MTKYRKRRYKRYSSRKWSPNISEISSSPLQASSGTFYYDLTLAENPVQSVSSVSQTFTVKNCEITFYLDSDYSSDANPIEDLTVYIMYVPQGMVVGSNYNINHPEYILAYKLIGSPSVDDGQGQQYQPNKIKTRLSRKLQTGDSLRLFIKGTNTSTNSRVITLHGIVRWWTKAN